ncbi:DUF768 domain-containing protein [Mesorhizobium sp. NZP2077]|nr:DUF768 domain-containing protein [Mesorhizobium sp. NZP2077]QKD19003.1 DUF768 domain-containing protein [Mesorhizobium sp. NZP2077]
MAKMFPRPICDVIDMSVDAKRATETRGVPGRDVDEEIGGMFEVIMQGVH